MKITATITTRNRVEQLKKAVKSVESQTLLPDELIIIDDNSSDGTKEYCENLQKNSKISIIYFRNEIQVGSNKCRNQAIERANGKYIAFLDDDDEWLAEKLQIQYETITKENADLVYTGVQMTDSDGKKISRHFHKKPLFLSPKIAILFINYPGTTSCLMFKSDFLKKTGGFNLNIPSLQDYEISVRAIRNNAKVAGVDKILVKYCNASNYSIISSPDKFFAASKIIIKNCPKIYLIFQIFGLTRLFLSRLKIKAFRNNLFRKKN
ncbi:MAG: glycosyltransferase family 2 protein [Chitinivibrionia bacterium]|nr:glycosyltransferase family 2 protein [Chitinivibrionia bacterium]